MELWPKWLDGAKKRGQLGGTITQPTDVRDLAGKLAGEPKGGGSHFDPPTDVIFRRRSMKRRGYFNRWEIVGVKFQPARLRPIRGIKNTTPVLKAPCA